MNVVLRIVGAVVGGFIVTSLGIGGPVSGINFYSIIVAVVGAVVVIWLYKKRDFRPSRPARSDPLWLRRKPSAARPARFSAPATSKDSPATLTSMSIPSSSGKARARDARRRHEHAHAPAVSGRTEDRQRQALPRQIVRIPVAESVENIRRAARTVGEDRQRRCRSKNRRQSRPKRRGETGAGRTFRRDVRRSARVRRRGRLTYGGARRQTIAHQQVRHDGGQAGTAKLVAANMTAGDHRLSVARSSSGRLAFGFRHRRPLFAFAGGASSRFSGRAIRMFAAAQARQAARHPPMQHFGDGGRASRPST